MKGDHPENYLPDHEPTPEEKQLGDDVMALPHWGKAYVIGALAARYPDEVREVVNRASVMSAVEEAVPQTPVEAFISGVTGKKMHPVTRHMVLYHYLPTVCSAIAAHGALTLLRLHRLRRANGS